MRRSLFSAYLVLLAVACGTGTAADGLPNGSAGAAGVGSGGADEPSGATSLVFDPVAELSAREQVVLRVQAKPPGVYRVRFALPSSKADPLDAVLDRSEADTDIDGVATVMLTAPSASADLDVRASIDSEVTAELRVVVKDTGFTSVNVQPTYSGTYRNIDTWTATVHKNKSCADLPGIPPEDGPLWAKAAKDAAATITDVPALTPLAVTLRAGHYVGGCASVEGLPAGGSHVVRVTVLNRPIDLASSRLVLSLGIADPPTAWQDFLTSSGNAAAQMLAGTSTGDVDTLLDAMRSAAGDAQQALENARKSEGWDALVAARWGSGANTLLTGTVQAWLQAGRQKLAPGEHVIEGNVDLPGPTDAELDLATIAGISAERAGFASPSRISWSAKSDDQVLLVTDIYVVGSRFATGLAEAAALELDEDAESAESALADQLDCDGIGVELAAAGADLSLAYAGCDASCLQLLCERAVSAIWKRGRDATALTPARLRLSATGAAYVGDNAEVAGINGAWIGLLSQGTLEASTGGSLKATTLKD